MADLCVQRRLAAILAADVVGYSRLIERDEAGTRARLRALQAELIGPQIAADSGRLVKTTGDGMLIEFASAVDAVRSALEIQTQLAQREAARPQDERLSLRIGINLGDVIVEGDDIHGDGVNVAARLEALCAPGEVTVSESVAEQVAGKLEAAFDDLGEQSLKNITRPVRVYRARAGGGPVSEAARATERPSIAVLPFDNLSGDADQQYFADGMVEEIITGLSRIRWLTVIARNSSFTFRGQPLTVREIAQRLAVRYVLEGSVRQGGERVRISAQLIEAEGGGHLWADHFDGTLADVFDLQDQITAGVVGAIEPSVRKAEIERAKRKRPDDLDAYDLYLRAVAHMYGVTPQARAEAMTYVEKALAIDPNYAEVHGVAAWCSFARTMWEGEMVDSYRETALKHARAVQALQCEDATTLAHAAIALGMATRDLDGALALIDRAIALNPSSVHAHGHGAVINTWAGRYDTAIALAERALRLSPFDPLAVMPLAAMAGARLGRGEYDLAIQTARRALQVYPTHAPSHLITIVSLMRSGQVQEARAAAQRFLEVSPSYRIGKRGFMLSGFDDELHGAGLPA